MPAQADYRPTWVAAPAICGAVAALAIPEIRNTPTAGATLLLVGALALLAGHGWGAWLVLPSHLTLVANLVPTFSPQLTIRTTAILVVVLTATPALWSSCAAVGYLLGRQSGFHPSAPRALVITAALGLLMTVLLLPVI